MCVCARVCVYTYLCVCVCVCGSQVYPLDDFEIAVPCDSEINIHPSKSYKGQGTENMLGQEVNYALRLEHPNVGLKISLTTE